MGDTDYQRSHQIKLNVNKFKLEARKVNVGKKLQDAMFLKIQHYYYDNNLANKKNAKYFPLRLYGIEIWCGINYLAHYLDSTEMRHFMSLYGNILMSIKSVLLITECQNITLFQQNATNILPGPTICSVPIKAFFLCAGRWGQIGQIAECDVKCIISALLEQSLCVCVFATLILNRL